MERAFTKGSLADAVARLRPGMKVLLPPACGEPQALVGEICRQAPRLSDLMLLGGIHLGDYPWARGEHAPLRDVAHVQAPRRRAPPRARGVPPDPLLRPHARPRGGRRVGARLRPRPLRAAGRPRL